MQLVIHAPFGSRINRAWGLALRKRFCRSFNFELQAAATDNGINISLTEQHAFPLELVFEFLKPQTVEDVLTQALLDAPMFTARWRWNASRALAILALPRRPQGSAAHPAHARRRSAGVRVSRSSGLRRESDRRDSHSRSSAGQRDHRQLPARSDGSGWPDAHSGSDGVGRHPQGRHRQRRAVAVLARDPERQSVCLSRRRAAGRTPRARRSVAAHAAHRCRRRRGHPRSSRHRARSRPSPGPMSAMPTNCTTRCSL